MADVLKPPLSYSERIEIRDLLEKKTPKRSIARTLARDVTTIRREIQIGTNERGIYCPDFAQGIRDERARSRAYKRLNIPVEARNDMATMLEEGHSITEIRKKYGYNYHAIRRILEKQGHKPSWITQIKERMNAVEEGFKMLSELVEELMKRVPK